MQLLCIARPLLQRPKILVIDEGGFMEYGSWSVRDFANGSHIATASVGPQSDELIQHALQTQFCDTTMICIAHRIATLV